jgi:hypothetical protein
MLSRLGDNSILEGCGASRLLNSGSKGDREVWTPDVLIECIRDGLADPSHKGLASKIDRDLAPWRGRECYRAVDSRQVLEDVEGFVESLRCLGEKQGVGDER